MAAKKSAKKAKTEKKKSPRVEKIKKAMAAANKPPKAPKERKKRGDVPTTGQSGPKLDLLRSKLNSKEEKVVSTLLEDANPVPINALAANCFSEETGSKGNSWVRNSLRRLARAGWIEKIGKGTYRLTPLGQARAAGEGAPESEEAEETEEVESKAEIETAETDPALAEAAASSDAPY